MDISNLPFPFSFLFKHGWLLFIGITFLQGVLLKSGVKGNIQKNPSLEDGYNRIYRGHIFYLDLPWIAMGIGMIFGRFDSMFDLFFGIRSGDPFSILFFGTVIFLLVLSFVWVWFLGGAEYLMEHPGVVGTITKSTLEIKIYVALLLISGILGFMQIWKMAS